MTQGACRHRRAWPLSPHEGDSQWSLRALSGDSLREWLWEGRQAHSGWMNPRAGSAPGGVASGSPEPSASVPSPAEASS